MAIINCCIGNITTMQTTMSAQLIIIGIGIFDQLDLILHSQMQSLPPNTGELIGGVHPSWRDL